MLKEKRLISILRSNMYKKEKRIECPRCNSTKITMWKVFKEPWLLTKFQKEGQEKQEWIWYDETISLESYYECNNCGTKWYKRNDYEPK